MSDEAAVARAVSATREAFGPVDIVLNNATVAPAGDRVEAIPVGHWDRSYAVNLHGPALLARACLPSMIERGRGVFVCVSSTGRRRSSGFRPGSGAEPDRVRGLSETGSAG